MSDSDRTAASRIVAETIVLPESEQEEFLRRRCGSDSQLQEATRKELDKIRSALTEAEQVLANSPPQASLDPSSPSYTFSPLPSGASSCRGDSDSRRESSESSTSEVPSTGEAPSHRQVAERYRPIQLHARGGLGEVFLAKDLELGRLVALKRIRRDQEHKPGCRERFEFEAEITGSLEHPGIVPVYSLAYDQDHCPSYAMRFIRGSSLTSAIRDYHRSHSDLSERSFFDRRFRNLIVRLIDSCNALQFAHERGVLHRDLKPDNIMLGNYGETLVVDWGLAIIRSGGHQQSFLTDAIEIGNAVENRSLTQTGVIVGTPMYMSPEQAYGLHDELTPATDVYSFGAMLFYIISGEYYVQGETSLEIVGNVRAGKRRDLAEFAPQAPKALVSICYKALQKSPDNRYASASALAEDLDRWLSDDPVHAHSESLPERVGRLLRKNRSWTFSFAAALTAIAIVACAAALLIHRQKKLVNIAKNNEHAAKLRTEKFKDEAVSRYRQSRDAIDTWLVQSSDAFRYFPGTDSVRRRLLTIAAEDYSELADSESADPALELERGRVFVRLGDIAQMREDYGDAESQYRRAAEVFADPPNAVAGANPESSRLPLEYSMESARVVARIALSNANRENYSDAELGYDDAIAELSRLALESDDPRIVRYLGNSQLDSSELLLRLNRLDEAQDRMVTGLETILALGDRMEVRDHVTIARFEELLGRLHQKRNERDAAAERFQLAADRLRPLIDEAPDNPEYLDALASLLISSANNHRSQGDTAAERRDLEEAIRHYRALTTSIPDVPVYLENLALTLSDIGLALMDSDRYRDALPYLLDSQTLVSDLTKHYGPQAGYQDQLATSHDALGQALLYTGETVEAQGHFVSAITTYQNLNVQYPEQVDFLERLAIAQSHYAQSIRARNENAGQDTASVSEQGFLAATETLQQLVSAFEDVPKYRTTLAHVLYQHGQFLHTRDDQRAVIKFKAAKAIWMEMGVDRDPIASDQLAWLLATCPSSEIRDPNAAVEFADQALQAAPSNRRFRTTLAIAHVAHGDLERAETVLAPVLQGEVDPVGREFSVVALLRARQGRRQDATKALDQATDWFDDQAPHHPDFDTIRSLMAVTED